jgi:predicted AAA+ superfamily ATPase
MAITNQERVGKSLDLLKEGLAPFVQRELQAQHAQQWFEEARAAVSEQQAKLFGTSAEPRWDIAAVLAVMWNQWNLVFRKTLGQAERTLVSELRDVRNRWAHQNPFSSDDAYRALDSAARLLTAVSAAEASEVEKLKMELLRIRFDEQARGEKRKSAAGPVESQAAGNLKPWREVVSPHRDVASGRYQQAEFAADLWQVAIGEGTEEYRDPVEFFRRTYLTESLRRLLTGAVHRLAGEGGDPVVQLQTNFGGGKTHSMLALYHLFSGARPSELVGAEEVMREAGIDTLPAVRRVVLVGNKISPGNPTTKPDGTVVRTLWGELAWQLGHAAGGDAEARKAFDRVRLDDERATSPGDALRELFNQYGPCLVLVDEWVAYARQLHDDGSLPAGSFETQFSFCQVLTESAKLARHCLLVISLPASDTAGSPHAQADDVEVGGERGRAALDRLRNAVGRIEASWRPASAEEGFEIVRRRLFEPLVDQTQWVGRDTTAKAFADLYRTQSEDFPPECRDPDYEKRIKAAYPIHPEIFDRLYTDWSTLVKFQRTRGVLRLMAAVIHSLWEKGDKNPLILPSTIPIDEPRVQDELTRYLSDNWRPVIDKDVDGAGSLPLRIDAEVPSLGRYAACRRVARTIYLGSAPTTTGANRGIEDRRIKLGCVMPGESPAIFGDALRRLANAATYLYPDGPRYWYSTQPTVTKVADDLAEQLKRNPDAVAQEIGERLRSHLHREEDKKSHTTGGFSLVHPLPQASGDVPDVLETRLVVLGPEHPYSKEADSPADVEAKRILATRGTAPRLYQNTLAFLAVDKSRLQDLDEAVRRYLAWETIVAEKESRDLSPHQVRQAETQKKTADSAVDARLPEAYQWLLVPTQESPHKAGEWQAFRLTGGGTLAARASKKLRDDELLMMSLGGSRLRMELDKIPLWRGDHVPIRQLVDDFARYLYLGRVAKPEVIAGAVSSGLGLLTWERDGFAYAESFDEAEGRYRGLRTGQQLTIGPDDPGLLVRPEAARRQRDSESTAAMGAVGGVVMPPGRDDGAIGPVIEPPTTPGQQPPTRFHGSVQLNPLRVVGDASKVADEVIAHLAGLVGSSVTVTLEIAAAVPPGVPENVVRTVTENSRTLKFTTHGFERE